MRRLLIVVLALMMSGCSTTAPPAAPALTASAPAVMVPAEPAPLPPPEALGDVIARMADPAVPGADKITLIHNGAAPDAAALDSFSTALRDVGYLPLTVTVRDLRWSDTRPGNVIATVTLSGPTPGGATAAGDRAPAFSVPMEFTPGPQSTPENQAWQLTRDTAESLLMFGTPG